MATDATGKLTTVGIPGAVENRVNERAGVVVLARGVNGLGMVRSLGMKSVPVCYLQTEERTSIITSRFVTCVVKADSNSEADILEALSRVPNGFDVLIAGSDYFIDILKSNKDALAERFDFTVPRDSIVRMLNDKKFEVSTMSKHGVPLPASYIELEAFVPTPEQLPLIIKPRTYEYFGELGVKNVIVSTREEFADFAERFEGKLHHYIAQEIIVGGDENLWVCNCTFDHESRLLQSFIFNRIRTHPAHYGVTSFARSQHNDEIASIVASLGKALGYVGPAMVEFKLDNKDGRFKYIEINPRIGMCNLFDSTCGVNNVYATYRLSLGQSPASDSQVKQQDDVYFLNFYDDLKTRIKDGESPAAVIGSYLKVLFKAKVFAFWAWNDVKPGMAIFMEDLKDAWGKLRQIR